jgi:small subunit ribosomal protein S16
LAVKIRLKKMGSKKRPFYRLVAADVRSPRDGRFIETLGYYNPLVDPPEIQLDDDKVYKWLNEGAEPTDNARSLLKRAGLLERWRLLKQGVAIADLDAKIEELRAKQPQAVPKAEKKLSKKAAAKEKEEKEKEEAEKKAAGAAEGNEGEGGGDVPEEAGTSAPADKPADEAGAGMEEAGEETADT